MSILIDFNTTSNESQVVIGDVWPDQNENYSLIANFTPFNYSYFTFSPETTHWQTTLDGIFIDGNVFSTFYNHYDPGSYGTAIFNPRWPDLTLNQYAYEYLETNLTDLGFVCPEEGATGYCKLNGTCSSVVDSLPEINFELV